ncbi:MAG: hypothetical protein HYV07_10590 [Deltaproteobacteria bacterium]|nr:hypothetical protein [Deltaproteobacteria bacterium]
MLGAILLVLVVWVTTFAWSRVLARIDDRRVAVHLGLATLTLMTVPVELCRLTSSLSTATVATGAAALLAALALRPGPPPTWPPRPTPLVAIAVSVVLGLVVGTAFVGTYWDETNGHLPMISALARGISPPIHPLYPNQPLPYHFGYDALAAEVRAITGVASHRAADVTSVWLFVLLLGLGAELGRAMSTPPWLMALLLPVGCGTSLWFFYIDLGSMELPRLPIPGRWYQDVPPGTISNFFQHPQAAGMCAFLTLFLLDQGNDRGVRRWIVALAAGFASIAHAAYFGLAGLGLGAAALIRAYLSLDSRRLRTLTLDLLSLSSALGLAFALGGTLRGTSHSSLVFGSQLESSVLPAIGRHLLIFAPQLLVILIRRPKLEPLGLSIWIVAILGFSIPNIVVYERSWDIVKFYGVGLFLSNALVAELAGRWWTEGAKSWYRSAAVALVFLSTVSGLAWLVRSSVLDGHLGVPRMQFRPPTEVYERLADRLGPMVPPRDAVFATNLQVAGAGGFATPGFDPGLCAVTLPYDLPPLFEEAKHHSRIRAHLDRASLDALRIRWVVISPADIDALNLDTRARLEANDEFERVLEVEAGGEVLIAFKRRE